MTVADQYAKDVLSGKVITNEYVKLAVKRHVKDLEVGHKRGLVFDQKEAQRWIDFAHLFNHWKNKKFAATELVLEPWQQFGLAVQFGWKRKNGTRRFRTFYEEVGRKNGKTTKVAIKGNGHFWLDGEIGAQVWFAATKKDQALIGLNDAAKLAQATPEINVHYDYSVLKERVLRVYYPAKNSFMAAIGRDSGREDGHDPSYAIIDEFHAHPDMSQINIFESGMGTREEPVIDIITTAGVNKQSPCYSNVRKTAIEILQGIKEDDSTFGIIYTLDDGDDWEDPNNWSKPNPNLDVSVTMDFLKDRYTKAKNEAGETEVDFKTKNLNIWTDAPSVWIQDAVWMREPNNKKPVKDKNWYGGLDLASTEDFCSFVIFSDAEDGFHDCIPFYFIPEDRLAQRQRRDKNNYRNWISEGYLMTTPGNVTDYDFIFDFVSKMHNEFNIIACGYDKWNASMLVNKLNAWGCDFREVSQTITVLSEATKELQRLALQGRLRHGGHPVLRWNIANIVLKKDANDNIRLNKEESSEKIDGAAALVTAIKTYQALNIEESDDVGIDFINI